MSSAGPMEIVASPVLVSVSNVFVLFHYLLWKVKLDFDCLEPKPRLANEKGGGTDLTRRWSISGLYLTWRLLGVFSKFK